MSINIPILPRLKQRLSFLNNKNQIIQPKTINVKQEKTIRDKLRSMNKDDYDNHRQLPPLNFAEKIQDVKSVTFKSRQNTFENDITDQFLLGNYTIEQIKTAFKEFDVDSNKYIGIGDIKSLYHILQIPVTEKECGQILHLLDKDGEGQIDFFEFAKFIIDYSNGNSKHPRVTLLLRDANKQINKKNNQIIQISNQQIKESQKYHLFEGRFIFQSLINEFKHITPQFIKKVKKKLEIEAMDLDNVSFFLFIKYMKLKSQNKSVILFKNMFNKNNIQTYKLKIPYKIVLLHMFNLSSFNLINKIDFAFDTFDSDKSGFIGIEELIKMLLATNPTPVNQNDIKPIINRGNFIMQQCDKDGNGTLNLREFRELGQKYPNMVIPFYGNINHKIDSFINDKLYNNQIMF